jgi:hypothetical protein
MAGAKRKKTYLVTKDGFINTYPSLYETKEKGKLRGIIKRLIQLRKGH